MHRVLISAFTCNPSGGSEPGAGWAWSAASARDNHVHLVTRNMPADRLEEHIARLGLPIQVTYLDPPPWIRKVFRGGIGLRLSYLAWQRRLAKLACELHEAHHFDVVHHVTFANIWLPVGLSRVQAPLVLGPVGGGTRIPVRFWGQLGVRGAALESARLVAQMVSGLNPSVHHAWRRADVILAENAETQRVLPRHIQARCLTRHHAAATLTRRRTERAPRTAIFAGRLVPWKGAHLAVDAIAELPDWHLTVVGSGSDEPRIRKRVAELGLGDRVRMVSWLDREKLHDLMAQSSVVVVPSLRDDSPFIVAEAQALGVAVAGFDQGGLATFARLPDTRVEVAPLASLSHGLADAILRAAAEPVPAGAGHAFSLEAISDDLARVYALATRPDATRGASHVHP